jgi:hypothetical protein
MQLMYVVTGSDPAAAHYQEKVLQTGACCCHLEVYTMFHYAGPVCVMPLMEMSDFAHL